MARTIHGLEVKTLDELAAVSNDPVTRMLIEVRDSNKGLPTELSDLDIYQLGYTQLLRLLLPMAQQLGELKRENEAFRAESLANKQKRRLLGPDGRPL